MPVDPNWKNGDKKFHPSLMVEVEEYIAKTKSPTIKGLCALLGVSRPTVYSWCNKYPQFRIQVHNLRHKHILDMPIWGIDKRGSVSLPGAFDEI